MNNYTYSNHIVNTGNGITDYTQSPEARAIYDSVTVNTFAESSTTAKPIEKKMSPEEYDKRLSMFKRIKYIMKAWFRKFNKHE